MHIEFNSKRVLVTGAAQGIGSAIANAFAESGGEVWITDIDAEGLERTQGNSKHELIPRCIDITNPDAIKTLVDEAQGFDIVVHSAGGVCGQSGRALEEVSTSDWAAIVAVNQSAAFYLAQAVAPGMKSRGHGRIITISSRAGLTVSLTGIQAYASAKAGQLGLVRQLAHELGSFGITVNSVAPGFIMSNPSTERQWQALGNKGQEQLLEGITMGKLGQPSDISAAVLFLASTYARWITGQTLSVDGG
jgi:3-oxoacyl-[acyl-carrier protein] reductase